MEKITVGPEQKPPASLLEPGDVYIRLGGFTGYFINDKNGVSVRFIPDGRAQRKQQERAKDWLRANNARKKVIAAKNGTATDEEKAFLALFNDELKKAIAPIETW